MLRTTTTATFLTLICTLSSIAQVSPDSDLHVQLYRMDSLIFEVGFNRCEMEVYDRIISDDLEFYHDQSGLSKTKQHFIEVASKNICGNANQKPIRKLVEGTMEVYPLSENGVLYGAIQNGVHEFFIKEPGKEMYKTSEAKFTHVWLLKDDQWLLKRVLSFDHH